MSVDTIVIGAQVDALVAAHLLARAGRRVRVVNEYALKSDSAFSGWIPPRVVRDLDLERKGLVVARPDVWAAVPLPAGGRLELTCDVRRSAAAIRPLSEHDASMWPEFCRRMHALAGVLADLYAAPPPDPLARDFGGLAMLARDALRVRKLGREGIEDLLRVSPMSIADLLDEWFESGALKGALGAAGVMHLAQGPRSGGTAFNFLHHHVGSAPGVFRPPQSNIDRVLSALPGVELIEGKVDRVALREGRAAGVVLGTGEEIAASLVVSAADPARTLLELIDPGRLDPQLVRAIRNIRSRGVAARVTLELERAPGFETLVIAPSLDYLERAYDDAKHGRSSAGPYVETRYEALENGEHRAHLHVQYAPYALRDAAWDEGSRDVLARAAIDALERHVPGLSKSVVRHSVETPRDIESRYGSIRGQAYGAEIALDQMLWMRPVPELADYRTPIPGLYLCGPSMHPGGGIAGAAGANAASVILDDLKSKR